MGQKARSPGQEKAWQAMEARHGREKFQEAGARGHAIRNATPEQITAWASRGGQARAERYSAAELSAQAVAAQAKIPPAARVARAKKAGAAAKAAREQKEAAHAAEVAALKEEIARLNARLGEGS